MLVIWNLVEVLLNVLLKHCCFVVVPKELCTEKLVCYLVALTTFSITSVVFIDFFFGSTEILGEENIS